jgi:S1-C subfamily serine protease
MPVPFTTVPVPEDPFTAPASAPPASKDDGRGWITRHQFYGALACSALLGGIIGAIVIAVAGVGQVSETAAPSTLSFASRPQSRAILSPEQIYARDSPGTVYVQVLTATEGVSGSGIVLDRAGDILTNEHVVAGATQVAVTFENNVTVTGSVIGSDTSSDLALIRVNPAHLLLHPLTLGNSNGVAVGDAAATIGAPFGLNRTFTTGVISATDRTITSPNGFPIQGALQTDAPINPGNSGGPLLDAAGDVIGINSQISTDTGSGDGVGFAIPINLAKTKLPELLRGGVVRHAWLGLSGANVSDLPSAVGVKVKSGAYVEQVLAGSPAAAAGLHGGNRTVITAEGEFAAGGDIITAVNNKPVQSFTQLENITASAHPGEKLRITYLRGGRTHQTVAVLGTQPLSAPAGVSAPT